MAELFEHIAAPSYHARFSRKHRVRWYSWSSDFKKEFPAFKKQLSRVSRPELIFLRQHRSYNYTYSLKISKIDREFLNDFRHFVLSLYHFDPENRLNFFSGLIDSKISNLSFQKIFALTRAILVDERKDPMAALYAPLTPGKDQSDFPLHCDLYLPDILLNVLGQVAPDGSGRSTFLSLETFFCLLDSIDSIPLDVRDQIRQIFNSELKFDFFDTFYGLLYDEKNEWCIDLKKALFKAKISIGLRKGEGYMINDRIWMHGRDRTNGGISSKRLHRLIYKNSHP